MSALLIPQHITALDAQSRVLTCVSLTKPPAKGFFLSDEVKMEEEDLLCPRWTCRVAVRRTIL